MTEKEKAVKLVEDFKKMIHGAISPETTAYTRTKIENPSWSDYVKYSREYHAKKAALYCVSVMENSEYFNFLFQSDIDYWQQVKIEIENL